MADTYSLLLAEINRVVDSAYPTQLKVGLENLDRPHRDTGLTETVTARHSVLEMHSRGHQYMHTSEALPHR